MPDECSQNYCQRKVYQSKGAWMIEGKLGHHLQVDEMRHTTGPACPAFAACRSAERCCWGCTAQPTCPAFTADESTFWLKLLSARTGNSACPVYVVHGGARKGLVLIWQHLLVLIQAALLHCWVWMQSAYFLQTPSVLASALPSSRDGNSTNETCFPSDRLCVTPPF